jgi:hypothetical protein
MPSARADRAAAVASRWGTATSVTASKRSSTSTPRTGSQRQCATEHSLGLHAGPQGAQPFEPFCARAMMLLRQCHTVALCVVCALHCTSVRPSVVTCCAVTPRWSIDRVIYFFGCFNSNPDDAKRTRTKERVSVRRRFLRRGHSHLSRTGLTPRTLEGRALVFIYVTRTTSCSHVARSTPTRWFSGTRQCWFRGQRAHSIAAALHPLVLGVRLTVATTDKTNRR